MKRSGARSAGAPRTGCSWAKASGSPPAAALAAVTKNAAYQYFEEGRKGTLRPGKLADMVILDRDPLRVSPEEIRNIRVMETIKEGKTLYRCEE